MTISRRCFWERRRGEEGGVVRLHHITWLGMSMASGTVAALRIGPFDGCVEYMASDI